MDHAVPETAARQSYGEANLRRHSAVVNLHRDGQLLLDETVTREYKLADINEGFDDMLAGRNIRGSHPARPSTSGALRTASPNPATGPTVEQPRGVR